MKGIKEENVGDIQTTEINPPTLELEEGYWRIKDPVSGKTKIVRIDAEKIAKVTYPAAKTSKPGVGKKPKKVEGEIVTGVNIKASDGGQYEIWVNRRRTGFRTPEVLEIGPGLHIVEVMKPTGMSTEKVTVTEGSIKNVVI